MRNLFANLCLLLVSCGAGLALCEVSLRLFYPKYRHLAEAPFRSDAMRIWAREPHSRDWRTHPDTSTLHFLNHNNLALRQHRNFSAADLAAATNIGVFGDSFTENTGLPVQYSFTEPLDYLLNLGGERFNVLNFGVYGYGPGQSLLHYEHFRYIEDLNHVLYVYYVNDLVNILETELFRLDDTGRLIRNETDSVVLVMPFLRRLHISYLVLDASGRLSSAFGERTVDTVSLMHGGERLWFSEWRALRRSFSRRLDDSDEKNRREIFRQLIRRWKHLVEHNGSTFSVVLLPSHPPERAIVDLLHAEAVETIDLYACFGAADPAHPQRSWPSSPYRFKNDEHWNEAGNRLAAVCLYRALEEKMGLPHLSEGRLQEALSKYYAAFGDEIPPEGLGGGALRRGSRDSGEVPGT